MDRRLMELRSAPEEGALRGGERQARAAFRLVTRDRTILGLILIEALALTGLWALFFLLGRQAGSPGHRSAGFYRGWLLSLAVIGITTACSVAIACAVDARIDGVEGDLRSALGEVRQRAPAVLGWWLISIAIILGLGFATTRTMAALPAFLTFTVVWGVGTLFVVPAIALQDGGPLQSLGEAFRLLRARWGRALAGLLVIGFVAGLALLSCGGLFNATAEGHPRTDAEPFWRFAVPFLAVYMVSAFATATREAFGVILARDALGDLPGEPPTVKPRRRLVTAFRRTVFAAMALAVTLVVVGALFITHGSSSGPTTATQPNVATTPPTHPVRYSVGRIEEPVRNPEGRHLSRGALVVVEGMPIGRVLAVHPNPRPQTLEVFFEVSPRQAPALRGSILQVVARDNKPYVVALLK